ncbi:MAG TPA: hypothetical protein PKD16_18875 [Saprospiraceae bacterium]|jgi:hypothetical protein|nr:hypothetical protein [Saprospiraceae bacterium]HMT72236.1 hypothetical protein [Saprospiraceae bacterium]
MKLVSKLHLEKGNLNIIAYLDFINVLIISIDNLLYKINNKLEISKCIEKADDQFWVTINNNIYLYDEESLINYIDLDNCILLPVFEGRKSIYQSQTNLTCLMDFDNNTTSLVSINSREIIWTHGSIFDFKSLKNSKILYSTKEDHCILEIIDYQRGNVKWQYSSTPKYDYQKEETIGVFREKKNNISNIIVEHNGLLWIVLATGILIALDVETGKEKYVLVKPINYKGEYEYRYTGYTKYDSNTNQLFGSYGNQYWELDLADPERTFLCYDLSQTMKEHEVDSITCKAWDGKDRIFFGDTGDNYKIGIFSRSQKTITWSYAIKELRDDSWMSIRQVEYGAGRLYVRDKFNVLHIFEDEEF